MVGEDGQRTNQADSATDGRWWGLLYLASQIRRQRESVY
jgi:hypothetical protein